MPTVSEAQELFQAYAKLYAQTHVGMQNDELWPQRAALDAIREALSQAQAKVKHGHTQEGYEYLRLHFTSARKVVAELRR